jgi:hypothetical protein
MLASAILTAAIALAAGIMGAKWQKKQQSNITKREAIELRLQINELRKMSAYVLNVYEDHQDVHKALNHHMEILAHNIAVTGQAVGLEQPRAFRSLN